MIKRNTALARRSFIRTTAGLGALGVAAAWSNPALAARPSARTLAFEHTHTREKIALVYALDQDYVPGALTRLNHFLRDHYSGEVGRIDPRLFDQLFQLSQELDSSRPFQVISGYRGAGTNERLRTTRGGGVARRSLHLEGMAIDIRLSGVELGDLRDAALSLKAGGVGYYANEGFVHLDTGRARSW